MATAFVDGLRQGHPVSRRRHHERAFRWHGCAITAALFLKRFVTAAKSWVHFDIYAWVAADKPHASVGGEAFAIRALYKVIKDMAAR